jgi:RNA polymerase sigma-70 factor (ECF subfamily)
MPNQPPAATIEELLAHGRWVRRLARSLVADPNVADDLEQQTWTAALARPPAERGNLRGWLARVLRHRLLDHRRGERRRAAREQAVRRADPVPAQDELLTQAETRAVIAQAVLALEEPYRSTILLRYFEEQSPRGIAALQGVAESTVRTRTSRALAMLRARLRREHGGRED